MEPKLGPTKLFEKVGRTTFDCDAKGISYRGYRFDPHCGIHTSDSQMLAMLDTNYHDPEDSSSSGSSKKKQRSSPVNYWKAQALMRGLTVSGRAMDIKRRVIDGPKELSYTLKVVQNRLMNKCFDQDNNNIMTIAQDFTNRLYQNPECVFVAWESDIYIEAAKLAELVYEKHDNKLYIAKYANLANQKYIEDHQQQQHPHPHPHPHQQNKYNHDILAAAAPVTSAEARAPPPTTASDIDADTTDNANAIGASSGGGVNAAGGETSAVPLTQHQLEQVLISQELEQLIQLEFLQFDETRNNDLRQDEDCTWDNIFGQWVIQMTGSTPQIGVMVLYAMRNNTQMQIWADFQIGSTVRGVLRFCNGYSNASSANDGENSYILPALLPSPKNYQFRLRIRSMNNTTNQCEETQGCILFGGVNGGLIQGSMYLQNELVNIVGWKAGSFNENDLYSKLEDKFKQLAVLKCRPDIAWAQYLN